MLRPKRTLAATSSLLSFTGEATVCSRMGAGGGGAVTQAEKMAVPKPEERAGQGCGHNPGALASFDKVASSGESV